MEQESKKNAQSVTSMGELFCLSVLFSLMIMILEPPPTLWERAFFCTVMISAGTLFGYIFRRIKLWQIARAAESQITNSIEA